MLTSTAFVKILSISVEVVDEKRVGLEIKGKKVRKNIV